MVNIQGMVLTEFQLLGCAIFQEVLDPMLEGYVLYLDKTYIMLRYRLTFYI